MIDVCCISSNQSFGGLYWSTLYFTHIAARRTPHAARPQGVCKPLYGFTWRLGGVWGVLHTLFSTGKVLCKCEHCYA